MKKNEKLAEKYFGTSLDLAIENCDEKFGLLPNKLFSNAVKEVSGKEIKPLYNNIIVCAFLVLSNETYLRDSKEHNKIIENFFTYIRNAPREVNDQLLRLVSVMDQLGFQESEIIINVFIDYSYSLMKLDITNLDELYQKINTGMNLVDFSQMKFAKKMYTCLTSLEKQIALPQDYEALKIKLSVGSNYYTHTSEDLLKGIQTGNIKPGKIALDSISRVSQLRGVELKATEKANSYFLKYGHAAFLNYYNGPGNLKRLHINPVFSEDTVDITNLLQADHFDIDILKLIEKSAEPKLEKLFGEDWRQAVAAIFEGIEITVYNLEEEEQQWAEIKAHALPNQVMYGLAPGIFGKVRLEDEAKKMAQSDYKPPAEMLCSEFIARRIILAVHKFNEKIADMSDNELRKVARFPFKEKLDLSSVSPHQLMTELQQSGCLKASSMKIALEQVGLKLY